MTAVENNIGKQGFIRILKDFLVNQLYIQSLGYDEVQLTDCTLLPLRRAYSDETRKQFMRFAFVNYFPAQYLLRKPDMALYPVLFLYLTPLLGVGLYLLAYAFWRYSIRYYKSSGN